MEEKKLARFSVKEWEANPKRRVVTQDGKDVRILCVDRMDENRELPVVALVLCEGAGNRAEALCEFDADGIQNGNENGDGLRLYFKETYADVLEDELLANGFRSFGEVGDKTYYKKVNAGGENAYYLYVRLTNEVKEVSYMRMGQKGIEVSVRMMLKEGTTYAEIQEWAEKIDKTRL